MFFTFSPSKQPPLANHACVLPDVALKACTLTVGLFMRTSTPQRHDVVKACSAWMQPACSLASTAATLYFASAQLAAPTIALKDCLAWHMRIGHAIEMCPCPERTSVRVAIIADITSSA